MQAIKCTGPNCTAERKESNHWFLVRVSAGRFDCRPLIVPADPKKFRLGKKAQPVCGQACAQRLFEKYLGSNPASRLKIAA